jgi:hypothetical protein
MKKNWQRTVIHIFPKKMQTANKYMKRYCRTLVIKEMQIKATMTCDFTPIGMAIIKKRVTVTQPLTRLWRNWNSPISLLERMKMKIIAPLWTPGWQLLEKVNIKL